MLLLMAVSCEDKRRSLVSRLALSASWRAMDVRKRSINKARSGSSLGLISFLPVASCDWLSVMRFCACTT